MPFQFFLFYASFFYFILKKKLSLLVKKIKHYKVNHLHLEVTGGDELATLPNFLELMGSVSAGLSQLSLTTLNLLVNFFFIHFSKKQILTILRINQSVQRAATILGAQGFCFSHKGKLAWKALSRKQFFKLRWGCIAKSNYHQATSGSDARYFSLTGTVSFRSSLFFYLFYYYKKIELYPTDQTSSL